jgi:hypothetical protein
MKETSYEKAFLDQFFVDGLNATKVRADVAGALEKYFSETGKGFTGSQFESLIKDSDPFVISERDLLAMTTLSVDIPARAALWILSKEGQDKTSTILRDIPVDTDIWDPAVNEVFADDGKVMDLWRLLGQANWPIAKTGGGLSGITKRSKIMAAKRPRLIPVLDRVVKGTLPKTENSWTAIQDVLKVEKNRKALQKALDLKVVPSSVSLLRRIDIVIWTNNEKNFRR